MLVGLLISLLSVTYTVSSSSSVSVEGDVPLGSSAHYYRSGTTGQKGQMLSGQHTELCLLGWGRCVVEEVELWMHSNSSSGSGSMRMLIGGGVVWSIEDSDFASVGWHGSFTRDDVCVSCSMDAEVCYGDTIGIYIEASKNSLYISRYVVRYRLLEPEPYCVSFVSGVGVVLPDRLEEYVGSGIVLPALSDSLGWRFLGWSEHEVLDARVCSGLLLSGERYFPQGDCCLWAVYGDMDGVGSAVVGVSGRYALVSRYWGVGLCGGVEGGKVGTRGVVLGAVGGVECVLSGVDEDMLYDVVFGADSVVRFRHCVSGCYIGYDGSKLVDADCVWRWRVLGDGTLGCYYEDGGVYRMLFVGEGMDGFSSEVVGYAQRVRWEGMKSNGLLLFPLVEVLYTTWPFGKLDGVEDVFFVDETGVNGVYEYRWGSWVLRVEGGQKYLYLH